MENIEAKAVSDELARICNSKVFVRSPVLQKLLVYMWEHRNEDLSEYAIAVDAMGRDTSFDPVADATVRVTIGRLRQKLRDYYLDEGKGAPLKFEIPLGSHRLIQVGAAATQELDTAVESIVSEPVSTAFERVHLPLLAHPALWIGIAAVTISILCVIVFGVVRLKTTTAFSPTQSSVLAMQPWNTIAQNHKPLRIIVPTPVFFSWKSEGAPSQNQRILVRDVAVNHFSDIKKSPDLSGLTQRYGHPELGQTYTVIADTYASITLTRFLDRNGLGDQAEVLDLAGATLPAIEHDNVIALGTAATLEPFAPQMARMSFALQPGDELLVNRHPAGGEPANLHMRVEAADRATWPGIIAVLPGNTPDTIQVLLIGRYTSALATFLTSPVSLAELQAAVKAHGSPLYFETAIQSEMSADRLVSQKLLLLHPYSAEKPQ